MNKLIAVFLATMILTGCTSSNQFGPCIGAFDEEDPALRYKMETSNFVIGIVFFELIAPPIVVLLDEAKCPIGKRGTPK